MKQFLFYLNGIVLLLHFSVIQAEEEASEVSSFKKINQSEYELDGIVLNQDTREIRFPAEINMVEGLLEYLIVHENGAVHESLFKTSISPLHLNLALTLLRFKPSKELYTPPRDVSPVPPEYLPSEEVKKAARLEIDVEYRKDEKVIRVPTTQFIAHDIKQIMPSSVWVYGGSDFYEGKYIPESNGEIAAIYNSSTCIINFAGEDRDNDEVWSVHSEKTPPLGTEVTIIIRPLKQLD